MEKEKKSSDSNRRDSGDNRRKGASCRRKEIIASMAAREVRDVRVDR